VGNAEWLFQERESDEQKVQLNAVAQDSLTSDTRQGKRDELTKADRHACDSASLVARPRATGAVGRLEAIIRAARAIQPALKISAARSITLQYAYEVASDDEAIHSSPKRVHRSDCGHGRLAGH
jgi:hypothetical protein